MKKVFVLMIVLFFGTMLPGCKQESAKQPVAAGPADKGDYDHIITVKKMSFFWKVEGQKLRIKLKATTRGWVGIGFNPDTGKDMKGADFVIGAVQGNQVQLTDHFGTEKTKHKEDVKIGGKNDVTEVSGSEKGGVTEIAFVKPLNSGNIKDKPIDVKKDVIILIAYGTSDALILKHKFRAILKVNLASGKYETILVK